MQSPPIMLNGSAWCCAVILVGLATGADCDQNLEVTTNQTAVCLGDYYCLFCVSLEPFRDTCGHSTAEWHRRIGRDVDRIIRNDSTHTIFLPNETAVVLKFLITNQTQTYYCKSNRCMSNVVSVGEDNITGVSLPIIENITAGTRCINLTWSHNKTCCSNSKNTVSWQQWQSEETSAHANKNSSRMVDPADHHLSITPLNPGTMYIVTVSVECQSGELQSIKRSINTTTENSTIQTPTTQPPTTNTPNSKALTVIIIIVVLFVVVGTVAVAAVVYSSLCNK